MDQEFISCASNSKCVGGKNGAPARLRIRDFRHQLSINTGYCAACRRYYKYNLPNLDRFASYRDDLKRRLSGEPELRVSLFGMGARLVEEENSDTEGASGVAAMTKPERDIMEELADSLAEDEGGLKTLTSFSSLPTGADETRHVEKVPLEEAELRGLSFSRAPGSKKMNEASRTKADSEVNTGLSDLVRELSVLAGEKNDYTEGFGIESRDEFHAAEELSAMSRGFNMFSVDSDLVASEFDELISRYRDIRQATMAAVLMFRENMVVIEEDDKSGAGMLSAVARREGYEFEAIEAPRQGAGEAELEVAKAALRDSLGMRGATPGAWLAKRLVIINGVATAPATYKQYLVRLMSNKRDGVIVVPPGVKTVISAKDPFKLRDLPPELVLDAVAVSLGPTGSGDEAISSIAQFRARDLERSLETAKKAGDKARVKAITKLIKKPGYLGVPSLLENGYQPAGERERAVEAKRAMETDAKTDFAGSGFVPGGLKSTEGQASTFEAILTARDSFSRDEKAAKIFDAVAPEKSEARKRIAEKLLTGIGGRRFAEVAMKSYFKQNVGPFAGRPTVEDVVLGVETAQTVRAHLERGDKAYIEALCIDLRESVTVEKIMTERSAGYEQIQAVFNALLDIDMEKALSIAETKPYFSSL